MKKIHALVAVIALLLISGCASVQQPITFNATATNKDGKVGILVAPAPLAETAYTGNIGLLDYAIIAGVNSGLDKHLKALTFEDYGTIGNQLQEALVAQGFNAIIIEPGLTLEEAGKLKAPSEGKSKNDLSKYKIVHGVDYILLVQLHSIGTTRSYYGPAPTSKPMASTRMTAQLVDIDSESLNWYVNAHVQEVIVEPWDESDANFPNLTTAVYKSFENARKVLVSGLTLNKTQSGPVTASK